MRARALLLAGLAVAGLATPSQATSAASVQFVVQFGCLGCGWTLVDIDGACTGLCNDLPCAGCPVTGGGEAYTSQGTCALAGEIYGDLDFVGTGSMPFILRWTAGAWTIELGDGTPGSGTMTISHCEGPGIATFTGYLGAPLTTAVG